MWNQDIKRVLLGVSVEHHCMKRCREVSCFHVQLDLEVWIVNQKTITKICRTWVRIPLPIIWDSSGVRTTDVDVAGSNPV